MANRRNWSSDDVRLMRKLYAERQRLLEEADKLTIDKIAEKFGGSFSSVRDIVFYQTYRNVHD